MGPSKIIIELTLGLILGALLLWWALNSKSNTEIRQEYRDKGFKEIQIDSLMKERENGLRSAIINLAG